MNKLQLKYNILHILYWMATCSIFGYVAVFLQFRGMTNTEIGLVTGGGCIFTIFLSPVISSLVTKIKFLTINKVMYILFAVLTVIFLSLSLFELPLYIIMILYILLLSLMVSTVPFLSMIAMNYIRAGEELNFGLARGLGSVSYAVSAVLLGQLIDLFDPRILAYVFVFSTVLLLLILSTLPTVASKTNSKIKGANVFALIRKYKIFFGILVGFAFMFSGATTLSTYLINIVRNLGGNTSLYGLAIFFMAASEMPVMAITPRLIRRYNKVSLIMFAACFYVIRNFIICFAFNLPMLFGGMLMQSLSYGLLTAVITYYVSSNLEEQDQMMGQTMIAIMTSGIGSCLGNMVGGVLQDSYGINMMFAFACSMTVIGSLIIIITGIISKKQSKA